MGGIFLKDAAVLAGLGWLGKNNLVITPQFGPRVRFRALLLDVDLESTGPTDFAPYGPCDELCNRICPQGAFGSGSYQDALCTKQMREDRKNEIILKKWGSDNSPGTCVQYCRACERACLEIPLVQPSTRKTTKTNINWMDVFTAPSPTTSQYTIRQL